MKRALVFLLLPFSFAAAVTPPEQIKVPAGFKVELLREAGPRDGSWISMTQDAAGRLYISPQGAISESGFAKGSKWGGLWRVSIPSAVFSVQKPGASEPKPADLNTEHRKLNTEWQRVPVPVGDAMGMLWAFDSLYVSGQGPEGRGIYRCKDTDGDSLPDTATLWKAVPGGAGEHGAHALALGPDKKSIYIIHGNSTPLVEGIAPDSPYRNWGEDDLLPRVKDPVATFFDKLKAPYGCLYRTDENGTKWELLAGGMRNAYDIAFNTDGELFTYDSDMEWDRGLPWYRPTRVLHLVPGGEYGFREGSAKWPAYYPDTLPAVCDIGVGCPTGVAFGTGARFPLKYQRAFFICDWTYGRILAVHMQEKGASYAAVQQLASYTFPKDAEANGDVETFLSGKALPITDIEIGKDGAMYMTTGGRGTAAALYRVSYVGKDAPEGQQKLAGGEASKASATTGSPATPATAPDGAEEKQSPETSAYYRAIVFRRPDLLKRLEEAAARGDVDRLRLSDFLSYLNDRFQRAGWIENCGTWISAKDFPKTLQDAEAAAAFYTPTDSYNAPWNLVTALGIVKHGSPSLQDSILKTLTKFPLKAEWMTGDLKLLKLRILQLSFARQGRPSDEWVKTGLEKLLASYPAQGPEAQKLNRELSQLLIWLSQPELGRMNAEIGVEPAKDGPPPKKGAANPANDASGLANSLGKPANKMRTLANETPELANEMKTLARTGPVVAGKMRLAGTAAPEADVNPKGPSETTPVLGVRHSVPLSGGDADREEGGAFPVATSLKAARSAALQELAFDFEALVLSGPEILCQAPAAVTNHQPLAANPEPVANPGAEVFPGRKGAAFHAEMGRQVIEKTLALMDAAPTQEEQIQYALHLRWAHGWTSPQRERYLRWFHEKAARYTGGNSFRKFIEKIHAEAVARVPQAERAGLEKWLAPMSSPELAPVKPRDFVKAWTLAELETALDALKARQPDLERGRALYADAQCARCHLFKDAGGNAGPDLSAVAQRFGRKDILEAMTDPNKVVSDQYALTTLTVIKFGGGEEQVTGLVQEESSGLIRLLTDPLAGTAREFYHNVVKKKEKAAVSLMPPGLLNTLRAEEVADLLAFLGAK